LNPLPNGNEIESIHKSYLEIKVKVEAHTH